MLLAFFVIFYLLTKYICSVDTVSMQVGVQPAPGAKARLVQGTWSALPRLLGTSSLMFWKPRSSQIVLTMSKDMFETTTENTYQPQNSNRNMADAESQQQFRRLNSPTFDFPIFSWNCPDWNSAWKWWQWVCNQTISLISAMGPSEAWMLSAAEANPPPWWNQTVSWTWRCKAPLKKSFPWVWHKQPVPLFWT